MFKKLSTLALLAAAGSLPVQAELERAGPATAATGNFPAWYQDRSGLVLDICLPNQSELDQGLCLLGPGDADPASPYSVPSNFPGEAFWWTGETTVAENGIDASLVMALEAAFANEEPVAGDQIVFARVRIRVDLPGNAPAGKYVVRHPFGTQEFDIAAGGTRAINVTEDFGFGCGADFSCALGGKIGPFLRPAAEEGGAALPFLNIGGKSYIADPAVPGFVTGSPIDQNYFAVEGPSGFGSVRTNLFTLTGRVHTDPVGSPVEIKRATYARKGSDQQVDVFVTARPNPGGGEPQLSLTGGGLLGQIFQRDGTSNNYFAEARALSGSPMIPGSITVTNSSDNPPTVVESLVVDEVTITQAQYDADTRTLLVKAKSSDEVADPTLYLQGFGGDDPLASGQITVPGLNVPPRSVTVVSARGGSDTEPVSMSTGTVSTGGDTLLAHNDSASTTADAGVIVAVLSNDLQGSHSVPCGVGTISLYANPAHGTATVNADCTISYQPNPAYSGNDSFSYMLTADGQTSNVATVTLNVTFVNHAPVASNDTASVARGQSIVINVLANDSDPDGALTPLNPSSVTLVGSAPTHGSLSIVDGKFTYAAEPTQTAGPVTFSYTVSDSLAEMSNTATVRIDVTAPDTIGVLLAEYRTSQARWRVNGTTSVIPGNSVTVTKLSGVGAGQEIGRSTVDVAGNWAIDVRNSPIAATPGDTIRISSAKGGVIESRTVTVR